MAFNPYPSTKNIDFYSKLISKKEFSDNRLKVSKRSQKEVCNDNSFKLFEHQRLVRNFLSPHTPYQNLLLFHDVGTGKTCSAISIAESHKDIVSNYNQRIIVLLEKGVMENFLNEIHNPRKGDNQCTGSEYLGMSLAARKKYIKKYYAIQTIGKFTNEIAELMKTKKGRKFITEKYSNTLIIIDEVHNVREYDSLDSADAPLKRYTAVQNAVTLANNSKLLLMSATPMFDDPREIVSLMNLFLLNEADNLKLSDIPKNTVKVTDVYDANGNLTVGGKKILLRKMRGMISYVRGDNPTTFPRISFAKNAVSFPFLSKLKLVTSEMSDRQYNNYINNIGENTSIIRQASTILMEPFDTSVDLTEVALSNSTSSVSTKFYKLLKNLQGTEGTSFIYSEFVPNGLHNIKKMLLLNGYTEYKHNATSTLPTFILLEGDMPPVKRTKLLEVFNSNENKDGKLISIIMGSKVVKEGITLKNTRSVHIIEPWHNMSRLKQVWGRAIRSCSHVALPNNKRKVEIFLYASIFKGMKLPERMTEKTTKNVPYDLTAYFRSEKKDLSIEKTVRILRRIAVDCELHSEHNRNKTDKINCIPTIPSELDDSTYKFNDDFYDQPSVDSIIRDIKSEIKKKLYYKLDSKESIPRKAIKQIVQKLTPIIVNDQRGYIIHRGNYLIFQPQDGIILKKSIREKISMFERKHPKSKIFRQTPSNIQRKVPQATEVQAKTTTTKTTTSVKKKQKVTVVSSDSVKGLYRGILWSDGSLSLQVLNPTGNSTGKKCSSFVGKTMAQLVADIKIPTSRIQNFIKINENGKIKISGKAALCNEIIDYYYPGSVPTTPITSRRASGAATVLSEKTIGNYIYRLLPDPKNDKKVIFKISDKTVVDRGGTSCKTLKDIMKVVKDLKLDIPDNFKRSKICELIKKKVFG